VWERREREREKERERERDTLVPAGRASVSEDGPLVLDCACVQEAGIADKAVPMALRFRGGQVATPILSIMAKFSKVLNVVT
jgi:hypothetical protein